MLAYLLYSTALTALIYPIVVHAIWSDTGFLSATNENPLFGVGVVDFAGCLVVHTTGGLTAWIAAGILGPRKGRFYYDADGRRMANEFPGHSVALKVCIVYVVCPIVLLINESKLIAFQCGMCYRFLVS